LFITPEDVGKDGYVPTQKPQHFITSRPERAEKVGETDKQKVKIIQLFINTCKRENITLVFTISPSYNTISSDHYNELKILAERNDIPLLDYHTKGLFLEHPEYYEDRVHLWDKGARLYSSIFARDIKYTLRINKSK
jgi:lysophospholipase L1-like esterase